MKQPKHQIVIGFSTNLFAQGLECLIHELDGFIVKNKMIIGKDLSTCLRNDKDTDILILELNCPTKLDLQYIKFLIEKFPKIKKLLISTEPRTGISLELVESGIDGYLLKSNSKTDLLNALSKIAQKANYFCSEITKWIVADRSNALDEKDHKLTAREQQILALLVESRSNAQIAKHLKLSENTVKTHRRNIQHKFGVNNLLGMVRYACRSNLIDYGSDGYCKKCPYYSNISNY